MEISNARCADMAGQVASGEVEEFAHHQSANRTLPRMAWATLERIVKTCGRAIAEEFPAEILQAMTSQYGKKNLSRLVDQFPN
jgi:hypothetical protein